MPNTSIENDVLDKVRFTRLTITNLQVIFTPVYGKVVAMGICMN
jgi:hypothetical protein